MGKRDESKKNTRNRIIEATKKLFFENGLVRVSTKDISKMSGVAQGSIFLHFTTKDNLLHEVIVSEIQELYKDVSKIDTSFTSDLFITSVVFNAVLPTYESTRPCLSVSINCPLGRIPSPE